MKMIMKKKIVEQNREGKLEIVEKVEGGGI